MLFKQLNSRLRDSSLPSKSKDLSKFVFNFDSDEQQSDEGNLHSSASKFERLKDIKGVNSNKMMPSLMFISNQENNYVHENPTTYKDRYKTSRQKKNFNIFEGDENQSKQEMNDKIQQINKVEISVSQCSQQQPVDITKKEQNPENSQIFLIQKIQKTQTKQPKNQQGLQSSQGLKKKMSISHSNTLLFNLQSDEDEEQYQQNPNANTEQGDLTTCGDQKIVQIVNTDAKTLRLSSQISMKIGQFTDPHNIRIFLLTPIPEGVIFNFQIHKYKDFMKTQYYFWLQYGQKMALFATAISDTLHLDKNLYELYVSPQRSIKKQQRKSFYIGSFVSDFKRQVYTLYDHQNYQNPHINNKVICTIATVINFVNSKLKCQQIYIPKLINKTNTSIYNSSLTKNLKKIYKLEQFREIITRYTTHSVPQKVMEKMKEQFKIANNTTRNAVVKDQAAQSKLIFLKVQQNRFKIRAGSGLSPIQILSYAIVHLQ